MARLEWAYARFGLWDFGKMLVVHLLFEGFLEAEAEGILFLAFLYIR